MTMRDLLAITKALADENRLRILAACAGGELCVCQIVELLELAGSSVSKHLSILKSAGLLESRKDGRWMHYRLADAQDTPEAVRAALAFVGAHTRGDRRLAEDRRRIEAICKTDPEVLCRMQRENVECCSSAPAPRAAARWPQGGRGRSKATGSKPTPPGRRPKA
jgi:ArsR family transcriptional regulator, arsenate/arsenite/antimonite-responsive transcriptional repressor